MNYRKIAVIALLFVFICGCKTTQLSKVIQNEKEIALSASSSGNYAQAVISWQAYFDHQSRANQEISAEDYAKAANDAYRAENTPLTVTWFDAARLSGYSGEDMHLALSEIFRKQNNLSRELTSLVYLSENYPETAAKKRTYPRLFEIYMETDKQKAYELWNNLEKSDQSKEPYMNNYFILNKSFENLTVVDSLANELILLNPKHVAALEWNGEKYYWLGENRYQREMEKYNKRKTNVQYQFLLNELKIVAEDFKRSRDYFEKLWAMEKLPRYASFLSNIYARLDNRERAEYYKKFAE
jgi:hypothetical protein